MNSTNGNRYRALLPVADEFGRRSALGRQVPPIPLTRVFAIGAGLPIAVAALNYAMIGAAGTREAGLVALYYMTFIAEVVVVGLVVGYQLERDWLRWTIYGWIMLLINLLTFSIIQRVGLGRAEGGIPPAALFAGQIGLCVTWACFGDGRWPVRLALMGAAAAGLFFVWTLISRSSPGHAIWDEMLLWQVAALTIVCSVLRAKGFRLAKEDEWMDDLPRGQVIERRRSRRLTTTQFGISDVLLWTTVLALFLGVARGVDLLSGRGGLNLDLLRSGTYWKITATTVSAMAIVAAIWMALGSGDFRLRIPAGMSLIAVFGMGLAAWSLFRTWWLSGQNVDYDLMQLYRIGPWWMAWVFLTGGLLAAMLTILHARGYRLERSR